MLARVAAALVLLGSARADAERVLVDCHVDGAGEVVRASLCSKIQGGVTAAGHQVVSEAAVAAIVNESPALACGTGACLRAIARKANAPHILKASVDVRGNNYDFAFELLDESPAPQRSSCEVCNFTEAYERASDGAHKVAAGMKIAGPPPPRKPPPTALRDAAIATATIGAASLLTSVILLGLHGSVLGYSVEPTGVIDKQTLNSLPAVGLLLVGAALVTTSGILTWKHRKQRRAWELGVSAAPGAAGGFYVTTF